TGAPALKVADADLSFAGALVTLAPTAITNEGGESATVSGTLDMDSRNLNCAVSSEGMSLASLHPQLSAAKVPLLSLAASGLWSGDMHFSNLPEPSWTGDIRLKNTDISCEAFYAA